MSGRWIVALLLGMPFGGAVPAASQQPAPDAACGPRAAIVELLARRYDEHPVGRGLAREGAIIEILVSRDGATWTMLAVGPAGIACTIEAGEGWRDVPPPPAGDPS